MRFLSRFAKTGLGIVPFRGTRPLHTYTFKQTIVLCGLFGLGTPGIDWVTFHGERMPYRLIVEAMRAKLAQNPEVRRILLATGNLILLPDHVQEANAPPEWAYFTIRMGIRAELQRGRQNVQR